jgi:DNA-binding NtrC family response regulator
LTLELAIQLSSEGVAGIFNKPANPKTLLEKVNETLARNAARDTAARVGSSNPIGGKGAPPNSPFYSSTATEPAADQLAFAPRSLPGSSAKFRDFTHRIWKVRDFRSVLLLQGEPGSPFESLARDLAEISIFRDGPIMVCDAAHFDARRLIEVLAPSLLSHDAGTLIVSGVEAFTAEQQVMLNNLISGRDIFLPFARRFRLVLAATPRLTERLDAGDFDETLYYKISSLSLNVPSLREMRSDIVAVARQVLATEAAGQSPALDFTAEAAEWLEAQDWPENLDQLRRTVLAAIPLAVDNLIGIEALSADVPPAANVRPAATVAAPAPEVAVASSTPDTTRPPFPISSDLAAEAIAARPAGGSPARSATAAAKAPANQLFAKPAAAATRVAAAKSVFRPASPTYQFTQRLEAALAAAENEAAA